MDYLLWFLRLTWIELTIGSILSCLLSPLSPIRAKTRYRGSLLFSAAALIHHTTPWIHFWYETIPLGVGTAFGFAFAFDRIRQSRGVCPIGWLLFLAHGYLLSKIFKSLF